MYPGLLYCNPNEVRLRNWFLRLLPSWRLWRPAFLRSAAASRSWDADGRVGTIAESPYAKKFFRWSRTALNTYKGGRERAHRPDIGSPHPPEPDSGPAPARARTGDCDDSALLPQLSRLGLQWFCGGGAGSDGRRYGVGNPGDAHSLCGVLRLRDVGAPSWLEPIRENIPAFARRMAASPRPSASGPELCGALIPPFHSLHGDCGSKALLSETSRGFCTRVASVEAGVIALHSVANFARGGSWKSCIAPIQHPRE